VLCTHHTDGFHGKKYSTEEQWYTVDGTDWFAADERRRFPENVVENQRKTHDGHASSNWGERRQEFKIPYPRDQYQWDQQVHHVHSHVCVAAEIGIADL